MSNMEEILHELEKERDIGTSLAQYLKVEKYELSQRLSLEIDERRLAESIATAECSRLLAMFKDKEDELGNMREERDKVNKELCSLKQMIEELTEEKESALQRISFEVNERKAIATRGALEHERLLAMSKTLQEQLHRIMREKDEAHTNIRLLEEERDVLLNQIDLEIAGRTAAEGNADRLQSVLNQSKVQRDEAAASAEVEKAGGR